MRVLCAPECPCPPDQSKGTSSCPLSPARSASRRSSASGCARLSATTRRLTDCSGWFSSTAQQVQLGPDAGGAQIRKDEQVGGARAVRTQASVLTCITTLDQSCRCKYGSISPCAAAEGHLSAEASTILIAMGAPAPAQNNGNVPEIAPRAQKSRAREALAAFLTEVLTVSDPGDPY